VTIDCFYEDWLVKEGRAHGGARSYPGSSHRGPRLGRVDGPTDARTSFYPCRALATGTTCSMRANGAGKVPFSRRPFFEDTRENFTRRGV